MLLIEDDRDIAELVEYNLQQEKFEVEHWANGRDGLEAVRRQPPDLVLLDLMLPDIGGLDICKALKADAATRGIPILMLTAKGEEVDRIVGFEVGADDYLTKPFSTRELVLRVKAILKRMQQDGAVAPAKLFHFGELSVDVDRFKVVVAGAAVKLTALEFKLLQYLYETKGRVASRDALLDHVWGYEAALTTRTVDAHIKRLREKLGSAGAYIETVRGLGYRFCEETDLL